MTTGATGQLGLALPVQGELSGTWGDTVNNGLTQYINIAIAGTLTLTNDGAVTLANTTGDASASNVTSTLTGAGTVTAQFAIVRVTGTLTTAKVVTAPSYSKTYTVVNAATGGIVTFKAAGQTGVSVAVGESAFVYFNGTDYVKLAGTAAVSSFSAGTTGLTPNTATTGAVTLAGTLATTNGGTNLTSFTSGGVVYASSSSALATGSALSFDGTNLNVAGRLLLTTTSSPNAQGQFGYNATGGTYIFAKAGSTQDFIVYRSDGNSGLEMTAAGNLGLGVTPSAWGSGSKGFQVLKGGLWHDNSQYFALVNNAFYDGTNWKYISTAASSQIAQINGESRFYNAAVGTAGNNVTFTQAMTLDVSGNLGIGTSSPSAKLEVSGALGESTFGEAARFVSTNLNSGTKITFYGKQGSDASTKLSGAIGFNQTNNADSNGRPAFIIETGNNGTISEQVRVTYDGNLLVGATTAVAGSVTYKSIISTGANTTTSATLGLQYPGIATYGLTVDVNANLTFAKDGSERMRITSAGDLVVGATTTGAYFDSKGNFYSPGTYSAFGGKQDGAVAAAVALFWHTASAGDNTFAYFLTEASPTVRGTITYNRAAGIVSYNTTSDYRLKENIVALPNALATVAQLKPRQFDWKETGMTTTGFVAHELAEVLPHAVTGEKDAIDEKGQPKHQGINTSFLVATLTAAIQEQQAIIESLKARLDAANL
jgi:hypothetical protein